MTKCFPLLVAATLVLLPLLTGCSHVLRRDEVLNEKLGTQAYADGVTYIEVSGLAAREGMGVATHQVERIGDDIFIKIKLGYLYDGCQPHFLQRIPIVTGNEHVYFGEEKILIWPVAVQTTVTTADMKEVKVVPGYGK